MVREGGLARRATGAAATLGPMLGREQAQRWQVEHLAGLDPDHARPGQVRAAPPAPVGHMPGDLIGLGDPGQMRAGGAGLLTGPAPRGPLIVLAACPRGPAQPVRGRRLGGVGGVLAEPALQLDHPRLQRGNQAGLLGVDRAQLVDHRGLHRDGGFQARGRDHDLQDTKRSRPLAHGPYCNSYPTRPRPSTRSRCGDDTLHPGGSGDDVRWPLPAVHRIGCAWAAVGAAKLHGLVV